MVKISINMIVQETTLNNLFTQQSVLIQESPIGFEKTNSVL